MGASFSSGKKRLRLKIIQSKAVLIILILMPSNRIIGNFRLKILFHALEEAP